MADEIIQQPAKVQELATMTTTISADTALVMGLLTQLECPVCYEVNEPPIFMCRNGHNVCQLCKEQVKECATCRLPGQPEIRNRFAEETYEKLTVPCENSARGCAKRTLPSQTFEHSLECFHAPVLCLLCPYLGSQQDLVAHLQAAHPEVESVLLSSRETRKVSLDKSTFSRIAGIQLDGQLFWLSESYDAKRHTFATQVFKNGPEAARLSDYVCAVRFASDDAADELTFRYSVPFASRFHAARDRIVPGNSLASLAPGGVLRYQLEIAHRNHEKERIADNFKLVASGMQAQDDEVEMLYIILMPMLFLFVVGLFKGWWNFVTGAV